MQPTILISTYSHSIIDKMKNLLTLITLGLSLLWACQNPPAEQKMTAETSSTPTEWVEYKGTPALQKNKKIVLVSGDEEYRSEEVLPQLAKILSTHHGFDCTVLFAQDPAHPGVIDPNFVHNIPGLENLKDADLMVLFTRFRALPNEQMQHFQDYLIAGKPLIGIRTATHAFHFKDTTHQWTHWGNYFDKKDSDWAGGFGRKVLGVNWHTHHGHHKHQSTRGVIAPNSGNHPITKNITDGAIWGATDVYGVPLPLPGDSQPLIFGQTINRSGEYDEQDLFFGMRPTDSAIATNNPVAKEPYNPNEPMMPIVWTKSYELKGGKKGMALTSTIGASSDMLNGELRRLLVNGVYYLMDMPVPEKAKVDLVGSYEPSQFNFHTDEYWEKKNLKVSDYKVK